MTPNLDLSFLGGAGLKLAPNTCVRMPEMTRGEMEAVELELLRKTATGEWTEPPHPLVHRFSPGVYMREIFMPAGTLLIGHEHRERHLNIILEGACLVRMEGALHYIKAPFTIESGPGVRKLLYILEDCRWATVHSNPDDVEDLEVLEGRYVRYSDAYRRWVEGEGKRIGESAKRGVGEAEGEEVEDGNNEGEL